MTICTLDLLSRAWLFFPLSPSSTTSYTEEIICCTTESFATLCPHCPCNCFTKQTQCNTIFYFVNFLFVCLYFQLQFLLRAEDSTVTQVFLNLLRYLLGRRYCVFVPFSSKHPISVLLVSSQVCLWPCHGFLFFLRNSWSI